MPDDSRIVDRALLTRSGRLVTLEAGAVRYRDLDALDAVTATASIEHGRVLLHERRPGGQPAGSVDLGARVDAPCTTDGQGFFRIDPSPALPPEDPAARLGHHHDGDVPSGFALVTHDTIRLIATFLSHGWVDAAGPALIARAEVGWRPSGGLRIAGLDVSLAELEQASPPGRGVARGAAGDIVLRCNGWIIRRLAVYRPLIYMAAFGDPAVFEGARLAIRSIFAHGAFSGDVLVMTDTEHAGFPSTLPKALRNRVHVAVVEASDMLDYILARYRLPELEIARSYQPIVYVDTDVLVDRPIEPFLLSIPFSDRIHLASEGAAMLTDPDDYHGKTLSEADPFPGMRQCAGFNSGIIAFANVETVRETFSNILRSSHAYAELARTRMFFPAADQCVANYVLHREARVSGEILTPLVTFANHTWPVQQPGRTGFVHFCGGVGNARPKLVRMRRYLRTLPACEPQQGPAAP